MHGVTRLRLWLVLLPLVVAGTEGGATLVDRLAPQRYETVELFSRANASHSLLPLMAALGASAVLYAIGSIAAGAPVRRGELPRFAFACLPPLAFALQEHTEYVVKHGHVSWALFVDPTFALSLVLQIPIAVAAYLLTRLLVQMAEAIAGRSTRTSARGPLGAHSLRPRRDAVVRRRFADRRRRTRGPPVLLAA
jgi:hypothetical protein